jgi:putative tryptophan/tyrosine transport system substrate-binding protein
LIGRHTSPVIPAQAGIQSLRKTSWVPAFAGTTGKCGRRTFIAGLATTAAWPLAARGQLAAMPLVGYLYSGVEDEGGVGAAAFRKGLNEAGFIERRNVAIEYRFANNELERLPELAAELVRRRVSLIAAMGNSAAAAKAATSTIPIVFGTAGDPVKLGLVASLNRPGRNLTGVSFLGQELAPKRLEFLHELLPRATRFALLVDPNARGGDSSANAVQGAASALGLSGRSSRRTAIARSRQPLHALRICGSRAFWWTAARCSTTAASKLRSWRRVTSCR